MKKSLLALAMVGLFASAAQAAAPVGEHTTDSNNFTIYGRLDLGLTKTSNDSQYGGNDSLSITRGTQSRLGFRGKEDLGNGLRATFNIEHRFSADTGANKQTDLTKNSSGDVTGVDVVFWRQAWVGLGGDFGEVRLGRQWAATVDTASLIDPLQGDYVLTSTSEGLDYAAPLARRNNAITYLTPEMNGFSGVLQYALSESQYQTNVGSTSYTTADPTIGVGLTYNNSGIVVSAAYEQSGDTDAAKATASGNSPFAAKTKISMLYGGYTFNGATTIGLGYTEKKVDSITTGTDDAKRTGYTLSLLQKIGQQGKLIVAYQDAKDRNPNSGSGYADQKYRKFVIGYHHSLSERTTLYADIAQEKLRNVGYVSGTDRDNVSAYGVGIKHNF